MKAKTVHLIITVGVFLLAGLLTAYRAYSDAVSLLNADFKSRNAVKFTLDAADYDVFTSDMRQSMDLGDVALYDVTDDEGGVRIVIRSSESLTPYIADGEFFKREPSAQITPQAVVGSALSEKTYTAQGRRWIDCFGMPYAVIGTVAYTDNYSMNSFLLLNTKAPIHGKAPLFLVDAQNAQSVSKALQKIKERYEVRVISEKTETLNRFFEYDKYNLVLFCGAGALLAALILYGVYMQHKLFRYSIPTYFVLGFGCREILKRNRSIYAKNVLTAFLLSLAGIGLVFLTLEKMSQLVRLMPLGISVFLYALGYAVFCELGLQMFFYLWRKRHAGMLKN